MTFYFGSSGDVTVHNNVSEPWNVTIVDTGYNTMTGGYISTQWLLAVYGYST